MKQLTIIILGVLWTSSSFAQLTVQAHAGPDQVICLNDSVTIGGSPISTNTTPPLTIQWSPNYNISSTSVANPQVAPTTSTMYYLTVTDFNGRSGSDSVYIEVRSPANVTLNSIPNMCIGDTAYKLTEGSPSGGYYFGPGILDSAHVFQTAAGQGSHRIGYVFTDTVCNFSDTAYDTINVYYLPFTEYTGKDTLCEGDTNLITLWCGTATDFIWSPLYMIQLNKHGDTALIYTDSSMIYSILVVDSNTGCTQQSGFQVMVWDCTTGISKEESRDIIEHYPNPAIDNMVLKNPMPYPVNMELVDFQGRIISSMRLSTGTTIMDVQSKPSGLYYLILYDQNRKVLQRNQQLIIH